MSLPTRPPDFRKVYKTYSQAFKIAYAVNPKLLLSVIGINAIWGFTNLPSLYINKILLDTVISYIGNPHWGPAVQILIIALGGRTAIEIARTFLSRLNGSLGDRLSFQVDCYIEVALGRKLNSLDIPTIESPSFQDMYKKIEKESSSRVWNMISSLSNLPNSLSTLLSGFAPIFVFNPLIGLLIVATRLPEILVNFKLIRSDYAISANINHKRRIWSWFSYHFTHTRHLYENRILGLMDFLTQKLHTVQGEVDQMREIRRKKRVKYRSVTDITNYLVQFGLNFYFFFQAILAKISLGTAQLLFQSAMTLGNGFASLAGDVVNLYENYLYINDLTEFLNRAPANHTGDVPFPRQLTKGIEFRHVYFKYRSSDDWILKDINFSIKPGENIALVGDNGAGKTTLLKLLLGFYRPEQGAILVDGRPLSEYDQLQYRKSIGALFQEFSEYPFSAWESIAIGNVAHSGSISDIQSAAKQTGVHEYLSRLPKGYDTPLSKEFDHGVDPSKGLWQRIALARTLFRRSQLLILDEPTSNVDPKAEEEIFEKIINLTKNEIVVLISHRFSTVRRADKILVLQHGTVVQQGTHADLMTQPGLYSELFDLQAKSYR